MNTKQKMEHASNRFGSKRLIRAVIKQLGGGQGALDSLSDVAEHGADGGFSGFIYYSETVAFFKRNRAEIVKLVEAMADDLGENPAEMVAGFNCLAGSLGSIESGECARREALREYLPGASRCIYGGRLTDDDDITASALAWFALEEVARAWQDAEDAGAKRRG